jgi:transposase
MAGKTKLINDEVLKTAREGLRSLGSYGTIAVKLRAIIAVGDYGIAPVAKMYKIARSTLTDWIKNISDDITKLEVARGRGRKSRLTEEQLNEIAKWLSANPGLTINAVMMMIIEQFNIKLSKSTVHRIMKQLCYSYITPRPIHYKQDTSKHDEFKKKY